MFAANGTCKLGHLITRDRLLISDSNIYIRNCFENIKSDELAKHFYSLSPKLIKQAMTGLFISLVKHIPSEGAFLPPLTLRELSQMRSFSPRYSVPEDLSGKVCDLFLYLMTHFIRVD